MITKYQIVPYNNGYHCVARNKYGDHILIDKGYIVNTEAKRLVFDTPEQAQDYIDKYLDKKFTPEWFFTNTRFWCPDCGGPLETECVIGADKTLSGYTERICSCKNKYCLAYWDIAVDEEENQIDINRYFCG